MKQCMKTNHNLFGDRFGDKFGSMFGNIWKTTTNYLAAGFLLVLTYTGFTKSDKLITQGSLTLTEQDNTIQVIETSEIVDLDNLHKYLRHHFMFTEESFNSVIFDTPLKVRFRCNKKIHKIVLKQLNCTHKNHTDIKKHPTILSAVISKLNNVCSDITKGSEDDVCITDALAEYHGHTKNFYLHIPDTAYDFNDAIKEFNHLGNTVTIYDTTGNINIINLQ